MWFSVVVPVYNVEKYLSKCVDSLITQTYPAYEIILVDDGSTDSSGRICDEYQEKFEYIKVIHKQNAGLGMARNTGIENVQGDFVVFVDSDDFAEHDMLEKLETIYSRWNYDFCKLSFGKVDEKNACFGKYELEDVVYEGNKVKDELLPRMVGSAPDKQDSIYSYAWATAYSMNVINKYQMRFQNERILLYEDYIFNIEFLLVSSKAVISSSVGYNYRLNRASLMNSYRKDRFERCLELYAYECEVIRENRMYDLLQVRLDRHFFVDLRKCIAQEKKSVSGKSINEAINTITEICNNGKVRKIINGYPIKMLGIKQRIFLKCIYRNWTRVLYLLIVLGMI